MKDLCAPAWAAGAIANAVNATAPTATAEALMARWIDDMSQYPFPVVPYWLTPRGPVDQDDGLRRRRSPPRSTPCHGARWGSGSNSWRLLIKRCRLFYGPWFRRGRAGPGQALTGLAGTGPVQPGQVGVVRGEVLVVVDAAAARPGAGGRDATGRRDLVEVRLARRLQPARRGQRAAFIPAPHEHDQHDEREHDRIAGDPHGRPGPVHVLHRAR